MKIAFLLILILNFGTCLSQKFNGVIHFSAIYDNLQIKKIPSYIEVHGLNFAIHSEGIYNTSTPTFSLEIGYGMEKTWNGLKKLYSGVNFCYRKINLSYIDRNIYYIHVSNSQVREIVFDASIERDFIVIQLPIGLTLPLLKKLSLDFSVRNNLVFKVISHESVNDPSFAYKLVSLEQRSPNQFMLEVAGGIRYRWNSHSIGLKYIQGLTPVFPTSENAYNQAIPSKIYFSSLMFSIDIGLRKLLPGNDKR